ncbi:MAG: hypothetical protein ACLSUU_06250 [Christensenellales bacterium]|nr:MAG TPA: protein of unknown function DUF1424 [Caudoviricetes sp.]
MKSYSVDKYDVDELYGNEYTDNAQERIEALRDKSIIRYRVKTIKAGNMLECEIYPIWNTRSALSRAPKKKESRKEQRNLNRKNAVKHLVRLINANFEADRDIWVHLGYDDDHLPENAKEASKEVQRYIRKLRTYARRKGWDELKYIYVTQRGKTTKRIHHHLVINFPDRDIAEQLWHGGKYPRANRLRIGDPRFKFEGMANYIGSDHDGTKSYVASRNLKQPTITVADAKFTRRRAERVLTGEIDPKQLFEKMYPGYTYTDIKAFTSDYVSGTYIYVRMRC